MLFRLPVLAFIMSLLAKGANGENTAIRGNATKDPSSFNATGAENPVIHVNATNSTKGTTLGDEFDGVADYPTGSTDCDTDACCYQHDCPESSFCIGANFMECTCTGDLSGSGTCFENSDNYVTGGSDIPITIPSGGLNREAEVHLPPPKLLSPSMPMVINIHPMTGDILLQRVQSKMDQLADKEGFVVLYPRGYSAAEFFPGGSKFFGLSFNGGGCCMSSIGDKIDDVSFILDLVEFVSNVLGGPQKDFGIDPTRIYATGHSNGGFMSHRLACEASDVIAAIAPVAGVVSARSEGPTWVWPDPIQDRYDCNPESPVSVLHFHDRLDPMVPFSYLDLEVFSLIMGWPTVQESIDTWRKLNGIYDKNDKGVVTFTNGTSLLGEDCIVCTSYGSRSRNVTLCEETANCKLSDPNLGHMWPGFLSELGIGTKYLQPAELMWEFFKNNPKRVDTGVDVDKGASTPWDP